jgi:hypothetical protein
MPIAEWALYVTALPRMDALQAMRDAEAAALPWLSPTDRRRTWNRWQQIAAGDTGARYPSSSLPPDGLAIRRQARTSAAAPNTI